MKFKLTALLLCFAMGATAQKIRVYQSGNYPSQLLKPGTFSVKGKVIEKHKYKFFNWVTLGSNDTLYKVSVVDSNIYNSLVIGENATLSKCFKLSSRTWRRKI